MGAPAGLPGRDLLRRRRKDAAIRASPSRVRLGSRWTAARPIRQTSFGWPALDRRLGVRSRAVCADGPIRRIICGKRRESEGRARSARHSAPRTHAAQDLATAGAKGLRARGRGGLGGSTDSGGSAVGGRRRARRAVASRRASCRRAAHSTASSRSPRTCLGHHQPWSSHGCPRGGVLEVSLRVNALATEPNLASTLLLSRSGSWFYPAVYGWSTLRVGLE